MNLTSASKIIQCEPWWNGNDERQMVSRAWRMGQKKVVHVFKMIGGGSAIDHVQARARDKKLDVNDGIISYLRFKDSEQPTIPKQYRARIGE